MFTFDLDMFAIRVVVKENSIALDPQTHKAMQ
jgi:hypothetical protein